MKKILFGIVFLSLILFISTQGWCNVTAGNLTNGSEITGAPGIAGVESSNTTLTWDILADGFADYAAGGYFWISYTLGTSTNISLTFYTSQLGTGDTDWAIFAPRDAATYMPVTYVVEMPAASKVWIEPIPFPEGVRRVKCVLSVTGTDVTDVVSVRLIKATR